MLLEFAPACIEVVVNVNAACVCLPLICIAAHLFDKRLILHCGVTAVKRYFYAVGVNARHNSKPPYTEKIADFVVSQSRMVFYGVTTFFKKPQCGKYGKILRAVKTAAVQHAVFGVAYMQNINTSSAGAFACKKIFYKAVFLADRFNNLLSCGAVRQNIII